MAGADFLAALVASCFLGAFPPVDLRAVYLVRAILLQNTKKIIEGKYFFKNFLLFILNLKINWEY